MYGPKSGQKFPQIVTFFRILTNLKYSIFAVIIFYTIYFSL